MVCDMALRHGREWDRSFRRLPKQRQSALVASVGSQFDLEGFDRSGERLQIHFCAAKILGRIVIEMKLAGLLVDDQSPFVLVRKRPDAVASGGKVLSAHFKNLLRPNLRRPNRSRAPDRAKPHPTGP